MVEKLGNIDRLPFEFDDGGRAAAGFKGTTGDCVVRAVAIATGQPYAEVYTALSDGCATQRLTKRSKPKASARNGVNTRRKWFRDYMASLGWKWTPTMHIGSGCTVHLSPGELPAGRLIVAVSKHYTAVIDGVIRDLFDPSERGCTIYPPHTPTNQLPKGARWLENGNGWAYEPARCVYGYWAGPIVKWVYL